MLGDCFDKPLGDMRSSCRCCLKEWPPEEVGSVAAETGVAAPCTLAGVGEEPLGAVGPQETRAINQTPRE